MDQGRAIHLSTLSVLAAALIGGTAAPSPTGSGPTDRAPTPFDAPLGRPPLAPPLVVTGGFGEYRVGHFHAAFDFGTGGVVGKPVFAPLSGHIERIRASGVGYGRSLYLRTRDGRLLQFGHLDAYAEPMASWMRAKQDSIGQYEQDLWPEATRFPIKQGAQIAWTGESGAGGPHIHFEIRRGDMAYHPQLAGLTIKDDKAPTLVSLTLEPLDDASYVEGSAAPVTRRFGAKAETLDVIGRVRAIVGARDGTWSGVDRMVPWLTRIDWERSWIECRMDSISWATDMVESDEVYDAGRVIGEKGFVLYASRGFRPRFIRTSAPITEDAGVIHVRAGDPPRPLKLLVEDAAGHVGRRTVVIRPAKAGPDTTRMLVLKNPRTGDDRFEFTALPKGYLRVKYRGVMAGAKEVRMGFPDARIERAATPGPDGWTAVIRSPEAVMDLVAWGRTPEGVVARDMGPRLLSTREETFDRSRPPPFDWHLPQEARFDSCVVVSRWDTLAPRGGGELIHERPWFYLGPESEPLRGAATISVPASNGPHFALYRHDEEGWSWVGDKKERGTYTLESRRLGWFAEFEDTLAPRIELRMPPRHHTKGPYNRWAIEAKLIEHGSGIDSRACYFVVDGSKVAAEWDPEADVLRWRPLAVPKSGAHKYDVVAGDRAGNTAIRSGTFMLD
jgi:hypothetical protein